MRKSNPDHGRQVLSPLGWRCHLRRGFLKCTWKAACAMIFFITFPKVSLPIENFWNPRDAHLRRLACDIQLSSNISHSKEDIGPFNLCAPKERKTKKPLVVRQSMALKKTKFHFIQCTRGTRAVRYVVTDTSSEESSIQLQCTYTLSKLPFATQNDQIQCVLYYANIVHIDVTIIQEHRYPI